MRILPKLYHCYILMLEHPLPLVDRSSLQWTPAWSPHDKEVAVLDTVILAHSDKPVQYRRRCMCIYTCMIACYCYWSWLLIHACAVHHQPALGSSIQAMLYLSKELCFILLASYASITVSSLLVIIIGACYWAASLVIDYVLYIGYLPSVPIQSYLYLLLYPIIDAHATMTLSMYCI